MLLVVVDRSYPGTKGVTVVGVPLILFGSVLCSKLCRLNKYRRNRWCGWICSDHIISFVGFIEFGLIHTSMPKESLMVVLH